MIDISYNQHKDNEFHTDDLERPYAKRRPTEYPMRFSKTEIIDIVEKCGFKVLRFAKVWGPVPRTVWLLEDKS